ncbi:hypothetical protein AB0F72_35425 [Actinoplanes sp. NPDC023936]|uniref:hypothetical protein n=1 Tax=Actinoplanes sp. NPDC023936 TaxID=3154910 RepID=UPI0033D5E19A
MDAISVVLLLMSLTVAVLPFVLVKQLTNLAHSIYRNRLWMLRDRITDQLRRGEIGDSTSARHVKALVDRQIHKAGRHTLLDSLMASYVFDVAGDTSVFDEILPEGTPIADRSALTKHLRHLQSATASHLKWGSVFGWFVTAVLGTFVVMSSKHRLRSRDAAATAESCTAASGRGAGRRGRRDRSRQLARTSVGRTAQAWRLRVERAEVEIMHAAAPAQVTSVEDRVEVLVAR